MAKKNKNEPAPKPKAATPVKLPEKKPNFLERMGGFLRDLLKDFFKSIIINIIVLFIGGIVLALIDKPGNILGYFMEYLTPLLIAASIGIVLGFLIFVQFRLAISYEKQLNKRTSLIFYILIAVAFWLFSARDIGGLLNVRLLSTPITTYTSTLIPTPTFTPTNTFPPTSMPTITPTATPASINELPWCKSMPNMSVYPCKYLTQLIPNSFEDIARLIYGNVAYSGRIAELYRDPVSGTIPALQADVITIIPEYTGTRDEKYYKHYFGLLNPSIRECDMNHITFPCWYISEGFSYEKLVSLYSSLKVECLKQANKTEYNAWLIKLTPEIPNLGDLVVLPVCP